MAPSTMQQVWGEGIRTNLFFLPSGLLKEVKCHPNDAIALLVH